MNCHYFIRIPFNDEHRFEEHMRRNSLEFSLLSRDLGGSIMYSARLEKDDAATIKITFETAGFLNFTQALRKDSGVLGKPNN